MGLRQLILTQQASRPLGLGQKFSLELFILVHFCVLMILLSYSVTNIQCLTDCKFLYPNNSVDGLYNAVALQFDLCYLFLIFFTNSAASLKDGKRFS